MNLELFTFDGGICAVRVRLNWRGKPVLQVQRNRFRHRLMAQDDFTPEPAGKGVFRDATRDDALEIGVIFNRLEGYRKQIEGETAAPIPPGDE